MPTPSPLDPARAVRLAMAVGSGAGLVLWGVFWAECLAQLVWVGPDPWFPPWRFLGLDFSYSYRAGGLLLQGGDPYHQTFGDARGLYAYPPLTLALHLWAPALPYRVALAVLTAGSAAIFALAVAGANRVRTGLGLSPLFHPLALLALLLSTPVVFALERGQCDQLMLPMLFVAAWALRREKPGFDALAGVAVAAAVWTKIYPIFLIPSLLALRRVRAAACAALATALLSLLPHTGDFLHNLKGSQHRHGEDVTAVVAWLAHPAFTPLAEPRSLEPYAHSLTSAWPALFGRTPLGSVPGLLGAGLLLLGPALWVGLAVARAEAGLRSAVTVPFLLWVSAWATFLLPSSFDYNLVFLALAALALWARGDGVAVHLLLAGSLVFWQPLALPIGGEVLFAVKLSALVGTAASLVAKLRPHRA